MATPAPYPLPFSEKNIPKSDIRVISLSIFDAGSGSAEMPVACMKITLKEL